MAIGVSSKMFSSIPNSERKNQNKIKSIIIIIFTKNKSDTFCYRQKPYGIAFANTKINKNRKKAAEIQKTFGSHDEELPTKSKVKRAHDRVKGDVEL